MPRITIKCSSFSNVHLSPQANLRVAKPGFENTLRLFVETPPDMQAIAKLQLAAHTSVFRDASIHQAIEILQNCVIRELPEGHTFSGQMGGIFIIIASGILKITGKRSSGEDKDYILCEGDYIGEISGMTGEVEDCIIRAETDITLIEASSLFFPPS